MSKTRLTCTIAPGLVSVRPYPCLMGTLIRSYIAFASSYVMGAAPLIVIRSELRLYLSTTGCLLRSKATGGTR
jgi:hypothetical protein